jgi:para-nitrobenzyl esterase
VDERRIVRRLVALGMLLVVMSASAAAQTVKTRAGSLSGVPGRAPQIVVFRGVPYAAPPVDQRPWTPPAPVAAWSGVHAADRFAPSCMQNIVTDGSRDPNGPGVAPWPAATDYPARIMHIGSEIGAVPVATNTATK